MDTILGIIWTCEYVICVQKYWQLYIEQPFSFTFSLFSVTEGTACDNFFFHVLGLDSVTVGRYKIEIEAAHVRVTPVHLHNHTQTGHGGYIKKFVVVAF